MRAPTKRPAAIAKVEPEHATPAVHLTSAERALLHEALRRGEDLREELEAKLTSFGRWLLAAVFGDDVSAALDDKHQNPVWNELLRRAGGPTLRVSRRLLYVALNIAALDRRIPDQAWRGLDAGRKELLLPLREDGRLRDAAKQVARFNLTHPKTRALVTEMLKTQGKARQIRLTAPRLTARLRDLREGLEQPTVWKRLEGLRDELDPERRASILGEIEKLRDVLGEVAKTLETTPAHTRPSRRAGKPPARSRTK